MHLKGGFARQYYTTRTLVVGCVPGYVTMGPGTGLYPHSQQVGIGHDLTQHVFQFLPPTSSEPTWCSGQFVWEVWLV